MVTPDRITPAVTDEQLLALAEASGVVYDPDFTTLGGPVEAMLAFGMAPAELPFTAAD
jgi:hypothetical protein